MTPLEPTGEPTDEFRPAVDQSGLKSEVEKQKFGELYRTLESIYNFGLDSLGSNKLEPVTELTFENDKHNVNGYPFIFAMSRVEEEGETGYQYTTMGSKGKITIFSESGIYVSKHVTRDLNASGDRKITDFFEGIEGLPLSVTATVKTKPVIFQSGKSFS